MMKMKKISYIAPCTERCRVKLEDGFMKASVIDPSTGEGAAVTSTPQDYESVNGNAFGDNPSSDISWE